MYEVKFQLNLKNQNITVTKTNQVVLSTSIIQYGPKSYVYILPA